MAQALERQLGAVDVQIDTIEGWTTFALLNPEPLDFAHVAEVFENANYELHTIEVELEGTVTADGGTFVVDETGQRLPLATPQTPGATRLRARVNDAGRLAAL